MRKTSVLTVVVVLASSIANASDVRRSELPITLWGAWAPSADACGEASKSKIEISAKKHSGVSLACEIDWVTVTATPKGPNYSTRSRCVDQATKKSMPPANLLIRSIDNDHILLGLNENNFKTYQRCR
jgi:hypothetical protein